MKNYKASSRRSSFGKQDSVENYKELAKKTTKSLELTNFGNNILDKIDSILSSKMNGMGSVKQKNGGIPELRNLLNMVIIHSDQNIRFSDFNNKVDIRKQEIKTGKDLTIQEDPKIEEMVKIGAELSSLYEKLSLAASSFSGRR